MKKLKVLLVALVGIFVGTATGAQASPGGVPGKPTNLVKPEFAATPAVPNGPGVPATPAVPANPPAKP